MSVESLFYEAVTGGTIPTWVRVNCPECETRVSKLDRRRCLSINSATGYYKCWRCSFRGKMSGYSPLTTPQPTIITKQSFEYPVGFYALADPVIRSSSVFTRHFGYLQKRGIEDTIIKSANIGACVAGYWVNRVIIPCNHDGELFGWSARAITEGLQPKYLYPKGMNRTSAMFNRDALSVETDKPVYIVEGVIDALALFPHAVAVLGKPTANHAQAIKREHKRPVVIALDGDAIHEGWSFSMQLKLDGVNVGFLKLPPGEDPATMGKHWVFSQNIV